MSINLSNGLAGLSLLTGGNAFSSFATGGALSIETRAARIARAQFTTPETTPPWKEAEASTPLSAQVSAIKRMRTIIDKTSATGTDVADAQTTFVAYKALERLRLLADTAAKNTTSSSERASLGKTFAKGLEDLQSFLVQAPNDKVQLAFSQPARRVQSVGIVNTTASKTVAKGILEARDTPVPGVTGSEKFSIKITRGTISDTVTVDLSTTAQPPTLDSIAEAFNSAMASVPMRDTNGNIVTDENGQPKMRWSTKFAVTKESGKWGFRLDTPGNERVTIDQIGAPGALIVASGQTASDGPTGTRVVRFDDPAGNLEARTLGTIQAVDRLATEKAKLSATDKDAVADVLASTSARAVATDALGYSYVVGTTGGDLGANRLGGTSDLFLTKVDSAGKVVWQRTLGTAANAEGAAVTVGADGSIVVAGTVNGDFLGAQTDGDMVVAKFNTLGEEQFSTVVRSFGADSASAVAIGQDGTVYVAGRGASGGGDAFIARLSGTGQIQERRAIDSGGSDSVKALAIGADGALLALTNEGGTATLRKIDSGSLSTDLASLDLGSRDARVIAVSADGSIAVGGAGGGDGFVARIDASLDQAAFTALASSGNDQVDSLTFMDGALYAGGRTSGDLQGSRSGTVDGFVARIDASTGAIETIRQFGQPTLRTEPVRVAAAAGGAGVFDALGLNRGTINPESSPKLSAQTSLRTGDEFQIKVNDGSVRRITISDGETLETLSKKISAITGSNALVTTPLDSEGRRTLRIEAKQGQEIELIAGAEGKDALGKLGIQPMRIYAAAPVPDDAPRVRPGGTYGLGLTHAFDITTAKGAAFALDKIKSAISMTQTAYRSLYWDSGKEAIVNGSNSRGGKVSAYLQGQAARYQAALDRLTGPATTTSMGF